MMEAYLARMGANQEKIEGIKAMHVLPPCRPRLTMFYTEPLKEWLPWCSRIAMVTTTWKSIPHSMSRNPCSRVQLS